MRVRPSARRNWRREQMEMDMIKLGRVSTETRGPVIAGCVEDLIELNDGSRYPKPQA